MDTLLTMQAGMDGLNSILDLIKSLAVSTVNQLIASIGVFFVFGLILYALARFTRITFAKVGLYHLDVYITGWIGTPVHELGHALFCVLFGHKIAEMKLFAPNSDDGSIGYVNHYIPNNPYGKIGNFFIGVGPIILGAVALYAALYWLVPNKNEILASITASTMEELRPASMIQQLSLLAGAVPATLGALFAPENLRHWQFYLFLYLSLCIASHMQLSPPDIKGMTSGLISMVVVLFVVNGISLFVGIDVWKYIVVASRAMGMFVGLFMYATIISGLNFVVSYLILTPYSLLRYRSLINPVV